MPDGTTSGTEDEPINIGTPIDINSPEAAEEGAKVGETTEVAQERMEADAEENHEREVAQKTGDELKGMIGKEALPAIMTIFDGKYVTYKVNSAKKDLQKAMEPGTDLFRLRTLWNKLTQDEQVKFVENRTGTIETIKTTLAPAVVAEETLDAGKAIFRTFTPNDWHELDTYSQNKIEKLIRTGVLPCSEALTQKLDQKEIGPIAWVAPLAPELKTAVSVVGHFEGLMRKVRAEIAMETRNLEQVMGTQVEEHNEVAEESNPPSGIEQIATESTPTDDRSTAPNTNDAFEAEEAKEAA